MFANRSGAPELSHIDHLYTGTVFSGISGYDAAHEQYLIVGMGGNHHNVGSLTGRLPDLDIVGHIGILKNTDFVNPHGLFGKQNGKRGALLFQGNEFVQETVLPAAYGAGFRFYLVGGNRSVPLDINSTDLTAVRCFYSNCFTSFRGGGGELRCLGSDGRRKSQQ